MRNIFLLGAAILGVLLVFSGCANRKTVSFDVLTVPAEVELELTNGTRVQGIAAEKKDGKLAVVRGAKDTLRLPRTSLRTIQVVPPVYDEAGHLITRAEIQQEKNSRNTLLYTVGGGALSFGTGLFISSLAYRAGDGKDFRVANPISIGTGVLGTAVFFHLGEKRDRLMAIERIKDRRKAEAERILEEKRKERERLLRQIEELKKEKARIEAEKKKLEAKKKKKKQQQ